MSETLLSFRHSAWAHIVTKRITVFYLCCGCYIVNIIFSSFLDVPILLCNICTCFLIQVANCSWLIEVSIQPQRPELLHLISFQYSKIFIFHWNLQTPSDLFPCTSNFSLHRENSEMPVLSRLERRDQGDVRLPE